MSFEPRTEEVSSARHHLRRGTAHLHAELDARLHFLVRPELSLDQYRQVLSAFYGLYVPLENGLAAMYEALAPIPVPPPTRQRLLAEDLRFIGLSDADLQSVPICLERGLATVGHWAGCLYVLEGASLGGQVISRALSRTLGLDSGAGASFFQGDGARTAARWSLVVAWLDEFVKRTGRLDDLVDGASGTFKLFVRWCEARGALV